MKLVLISLLIVFSNVVLAQDPAEYFSLFDNKVYSLKTKGVKDFVVDLSSSKLTQQMNDQKTFGTVKKLVFRVYWTANPERLDIEVLGLPDGFREAKEELKANLLPVLDNIVPMTLVQRFNGYKFAATKPREFTATDSTGLAPVPSYLLRFDEQDKLVEIRANRTVGMSTMELSYEKKAFSDGKWVLLSTTNVSSENNQTITSTRKVDHGSSQGFGVVTAVTMTTEQKWSKPELKPVIQSDVIKFDNYKINGGEGFKHFQSENPKASP